jgi:hypothetical protein
MYVPHHAESVQADKKKPMFSICIAGTFIPFVLRTIPGWMAFTTAHLQRQSQTHESNESGRRGEETESAGKMANGRVRGET